MAKGKVRRGARALGRGAASLARGWKGTAMQTGAGAVGYFAHKFAAERVEFFQKQPLAGPLAVVAAGHFAKRKWPVIGGALCAVGGYAGAMAYDVQQQAKKNAPPADGTKALTPPSDITRALTSPSEIQGLDDLDFSGGGELDMSEAMSLGL